MPSAADTQLRSAPESHSPFRERGLAAILDRVDS